MDTSSEVKTTVRIKDDAVDKLFENVLSGQTAILSVDILKTMLNVRENCLGSNPTESKASQSFCSSSLNEESSVALDTFEMVSNSGRSSSVTFTDDVNESEWLKYVKRAKVHLEEKNKPPKAHSEEFTKAETILKEKPLGLQPPDFSSLPFELQEAFTVSTAYLATLLNTLSNVQSRQLEIMLNRQELVMNNNSQLLESIKGLNDHMGSLEKSTSLQKPVQNVANSSTPVKVKPYNIVAAFESHLIKTKMTEEEVNKNGLAVSKMIPLSSEALAYMAKFGFVPKHKKK